jgi:hypothetical protein
VVTSKPDTQVGQETREFLAALNGELERQAAVRRELRRAREEKESNSLAETVKAVHPEKKNEAEGKDEREEGRSNRWRDKIAKKVEAKKEEVK